MFFNVLDRVKIMEKQEVAKQEIERELQELRDELKRLEYAYTVDLPEQYESAKPKLKRLAMLLSIHQKKDC